jgi:large subunit ribosomal protein L30
MANEGKEAKKRLAVVRVRGSIHLKPGIKKTLCLLKLKEPQNCVLVDSRPEYWGMINEVNDYVTWGEIQPSTLEKLLLERGGINGGRLTEGFMKEKTGYGSIGGFVAEYMDFKAELDDIPSFKKVFRLNPPRKGFERLGIKKPYSIGGVLGYRGVKINQLIERML